MADMTEDDRNIFARYALVVRVDGISVAALQMGDLELDRENKQLTFTDLYVFPVNASHGGFIPTGETAQFAFTVNRPGGDIAAEFSGCESLEYTEIEWEGDPDFPNVIRCQVTIRYGSV